MAYPSPERTWYLKKNISLPTSGNGLTDNRRLLLAIKNGLTVATGWTDLAGAAVVHPLPWTVRQSSNRSSAGADDYWDAEGDLVWNRDSTPTGSWICLKHPVQYGGAGELRLYAWSYASEPQQTDIRYASHGYNLDGTVNAVPTLRSLEVAPGDPTPYRSVSWDWMPGPGAYWHRYASSTSFSAAVHIWHSSDGTGTRVLVMQNGAPGALMVWDQAVNLLSTVDVYGKAYWPDGYVNGMMLRGATLDNDSFDATQLVRGLVRANGLPYGPGWLDTIMSSASLWYYDNSSLDRILVANEMSGNWPIEPMYLYGWTGGCRGLAGRLRDTWMTNAASGVDGTMFDSGALVKVGSLLLPWDNSTFITGS